MKALLSSERGCDMAAAAEEEVYGWRSERESATRELQRHEGGREACRAWNC